MQQQVTEIAGVEREQAGLIERIHMLTLAVRDTPRYHPGVRSAGDLPAFFHLSSKASQPARGEAFFIEVFGIDQAV